MHSEHRGSGLGKIFLLVSFFILVWVNRASADVNSVALFYGSIVIALIGIGLTLSGKTYREYVKD